MKFGFIVLGVLALGVVIAVGIDSIVAQGNARCRCRLTHNGGVGTDVHIAPQGDNATHIEDDDFLI